MPNFTCVQCKRTHYNLTYPPFECENPMCRSRQAFTGYPDKEEKDGCGKAAVFLLAVSVVLSASVAAVLAAVF